MSIVKFFKEALGLTPKADPLANFLNQLREAAGPQPSAEEMAKQGEAELLKVQGMSEEEQEAAINRGEVSRVALMIGKFEQEQKEAREACAKHPAITEGMTLTHLTENYKVRVTKQSKINPYSVEVVPLNRDNEERLHRELTENLNSFSIPGTFVYIGRTEEVYKTTNIFTTNIELLKSFKIDDAK